MIAKFRGKPISPTAYGTDFVHGDKLELPQGTFIIPEQADGQIKHYGQDVLCIDCFVEVHPETVGQWTNAGEHYSGDRITFLPSDGSSNKRQFGVIEYCDMRACFIAKSDFWSIPLHSCIDVEVIGTIHDQEEREE